MDIRSVSASSSADSVIEQEIQKYLDQIEQLANNPENLDEIKALEAKIQTLIDEVTSPSDKAALNDDLKTLRDFISFYETDWESEENPIDTKRDLRLIDTLIDGEFHEVTSGQVTPQHTIYNELSIIQTMVDDLKNCDAGIDKTRIADELKRIGLIKKQILAQLPSLKDPTLAAQLKDLLTDPNHGLPFYLSDVDYFTIDGLINQMKDYLDPGSVPTPPVPTPEPMPNPGTTVEDKIKYDLYEIQQLANSSGSYAEIQNLITDICLLTSQVTNPGEKAALTSYITNLEQIVQNFGNIQPTISKGNALLIEQMIEGQFDCILTDPNPRMPGPILLELAMMQTLVTEMKACGDDPARLAALQKMFNQYSAEVYVQSNQLEPDIAQDIQEKLTDPNDGIPYFMGTGQLDVLAGFVHQIQAEVAVAKLNS